MTNYLIPFLKETIETAEKKFPYVTATLFSNSGIEISLDKKDERLASAPSNMGFVLSIFNGEYFEEFASDTLDQDALASFCRNAIASVTLHEIKHELSVPPLETKSYKTEEEISPNTMSLKEKIDLFRQKRTTILAGKNVANCSINYSEEQNNKVFISRKAVITEDIRRISHYLTAYVSDGKEVKYNYLTTGGTGGLELIETSDNDIADLVETANRLLQAENIEPGFYDVVATPEIAGLIAHEAFGHGVETDMYLKDRARSRDFLGKQIASPLVSIIDDPTLPGGYGSYFIDDEGHLARPTYIIREGKFVQGLTNNYASSVLKLPPTANGRRESFERKVYTRMSNTFFKPGKSTPQEIITSVDKGVYLMKGLSGMEDPKGWGIQVLVLYGKEIKNGRVTDRIYSPLGITGFVPDLLKNITIVGNDFKVDTGLCGKGYKEYIPVSSGGPHIRTRVRLG